MSDIKEILLNYSNRFNQDIEKYIPQVDSPQYRAVNAMRYSVLNGGKRLRPFLLHETASLFDIDYDTALPVAIALEMIHTYSLIHDDLPAMDNDDLRRGKPTCHKAFDEATAILAGDGLLTYAFEVISKANLADSKKIELITLLSQYAGAFNGMIAGQVLDMYTDKNEINTNQEEIIKQTQALKTGCLLRYPCIAGAILGNASIKEREVLDDFAKNIGLAFQITDDILDVEGDEKVVGKTLKKDNAQHKLNFVSIYGVDKARKKAESLILEAIELLNIFGVKSDNMKKLSRYFLTRNY